MGGLGCPVAHYLISSGIGYLTLMDPDKVELSNLSGNHFTPKEMLVV